MLCYQVHIIMKMNYVNPAATYNTIVHTATRTATALA